MQVVFTNLYVNKSCVQWYRYTRSAVENTTNFIAIS